MGRPTRPGADQVGPRSSFAAVSERAATQFGVVSVDQLLARGATHDLILAWTRDGRLHRLYRGVYAVGHLALTPRSRELASVLACGPDALLSHRSAAAAHNLTRPVREIEVTAPRSRAGHSGFLLHRSRRIGPQDRTEVGGIPTTTVARTLVDLASVLDEKRLASAVHEAEVLRLFDLKAVHEALTRLQGRKGARLLIQVLSQYEPSPKILRSEGERRVVALCEDYGLPVPQTAATKAGYELDCLWPHAGLAVEFDGEAFHNTTKAYYEDRRRDRKLRVAGIQVIRVTWRDLEPDPTDLLADLRRLLL